LPKRLTFGHRKTKVEPKVVQVRANKADKSILQLAKIHEIGEALDFLKTIFKKMRILL
jgi:hypothetical protein